MPELPEVETIRRILQPQVKGQSITAVDIRNEQVIAYPDPEAFVRNLSGGSQIRYLDVRRFGRIWYLRKGEDITITGAHKLGLEPSSKKLTPQYLREKLGGRKKPIKEMLHDQTIVAGIGNIYSDEILFAAGICPEQKCCELTEEDWAALAEKIPEIISRGIRKNRMTPEQYLEGKGKEYRNTPHLRAYGHEGKPCPNCGTLFEKITVGGRSSCFCPNCQRKRT